MSTQKGYCQWGAWGFVLAAEVFTGSDGNSSARVLRRAAPGECGPISRVFAHESALRFSLLFDPV
ncbi:hypothetical protein AQ490_15960 [Wenjunlia vitaminophila]|uniref:Uncharacterized protein n=1 Tax=Wenjunlia vitaminophila TaxID=76728 RepID=A0A0T6LX37_WENVI|nr:hypothetical protein AQ490_15960 [Wenjunlia vitaminophila]